MRWFSCLRLLRRKRPCVSLERDAPKVTPGQRAASAALADAMTVGPVVEGMRSEMLQHSAFFARVRERNHFAESLNEIYRRDLP